MYRAGGHDVTNAHWVGIGDVMPTRPIHFVLLKNQSGWHSNFWVGICPPKTPLVAPIYYSGAAYPVQQVRRAPYHFFISRTIYFLFIH